VVVAHLDKMRLQADLAAVEHLTQLALLEIHLLQIQAKETMEAAALKIHQQVFRAAVAVEHLLLL
jgi:hypothetical protein